MGMRRASRLTASLQLAGTLAFVTAPVFLLSSPLLSSPCHTHFTLIPSFSTFVSHVLH